MRDLFVLDQSGVAFASVVGSILNMIKKLAVLVFLCWAASVGSAFASVRLNEIAWMGTQVSGANEWIELYNDAPGPVNFSGWRIEAEDGSPDILLTGSIVPNGYFLIERTDDTTVPNIPADVVASFGNGLSNSGETLHLKDATGVIQDTVIGGANWTSIGGDSTTKQTAQRSPSGHAWITATATPRAVNVSSGEIKDSPAAVYPRKEITVVAGAVEQVFTAFPVVFSGHALGLTDEPLRDAVYRWNFGDGATAEGIETTHVYHFAGEYAVTLEVSSGSLKNSDRIAVTVTDPDVVITRMGSGPDGFIELSDRAGREVDLSGWSLTAPETSKKFLFAQNTILPRGKSVRFPNVVTQLGDTDGTRELRTPNGTLVYRSLGTHPLPQTGGVVAGAMTTKEKSTQPAALSFALADAQKIEKRETLPSASDTAATVLWERGGTPVSGQFSSEMRWFFAFMGLLLIALAGFIIVRSRVDEATIADEYAIIEDIIESEADLVRKSQKIIAE